MLGGAEGDGFVRLRLDAGGNALPVAAMLVAASRELSLPRGRLRVDFGCDPIGALMGDGALAGDRERLEHEAADLAARCAASDSDPALADGRAISISTRPYHLAGADAALELGIALATGVHYLRRMVEAGLDADRASRQITFDLQIGRDFFMEVAKLRALRLTWDRVLRASGAVDPAPAWVFAETSYRTLTVRDPYVNILRGTSGALAAAVGGADAIAVQPFDAALGRPEAAARRIARNTQTVLAEESHVDQVLDPAGGSWFVESLTDRLARAGWDVLQSLEEPEGGIVGAIEGGALAARVAEVAKTRRKNIDRRRDAITGVSVYADADERLVRSPRGGDEPARVEAERRVAQHREQRGALPSIVCDGFAGAVDAFVAGATLGEVSRSLRSGTRMTALEPLDAARDSEPFERLRDRADEIAASASRPSVFLANLGPAKEHRARAGFARDFFRAGGFDVVEGQGTGALPPAEAAEALAREAVAPIVCLCGSDDRYRSHAKAGAERLVAGGSRTVVLAGKAPLPEAELERAGISGYAHLGCDARELLDYLLSEFARAAEASS